MKVTRGLADDGKWKRWLRIGGGGNVRRLLTIGGRDDKVAATMRGGGKRHALSGLETVT